MNPSKHSRESDATRIMARDLNSARTMIIHAADKLAYVKSQQLNPATAPFLFEEIYEVMKECARGLMAADGRAPHSEEDIVTFLEEHYLGYYGELLIRSFEQYTGIKNDIVTRGVSASVDQVIGAIEIAEEFLRVTQDILEAKRAIMV